MSGRKRKYPEYNPELIMEELLTAVSDLYVVGYSLRKIGGELDLDQQKVRKLLCTATVKGLCSYRSDIGDEVLGYYARNKSVPEIMELTGLSRASVMSYLPYVKVPYREEEISANAQRLRIFRERQKAVEGLKEDPGTLWEALTAFQGYPFQTVTGLKYSYRIEGGEMIVNRKTLVITKSTAEMACQKAQKLDGHVSGPRMLGVFGASYLFPVFERLGITKCGKIRGYHA